MGKHSQVARERETEKLIMKSELWMHDSGSTGKIKQKKSSDRDWYRSFVRR